jgi:transposase, IS5 family
MWLVQWPAIEVHAAKLGRVPRLVAADAGFYSAKNLQRLGMRAGAGMSCRPGWSRKLSARSIWNAGRSCG